MSASKTEIAIAMETVRPKSRKNLPIMPSANATGRKTAKIVAPIATTGMATSAVPRLAATRGEKPFSTHRKMFSRTTMPSSMTRPTTNANPNSEIWFSEMPNRFIKNRVAIIITGSPAMVTNVFRRSRKKKSITNAASTAA